MILDLLPIGMLKAADVKLGLAIVNNGATEANIEDNAAGDKEALGATNIQEVAAVDASAAMAAKVVGS